MYVCISLTKNLTPVLEQKQTTQQQCSRLDNSLAPHHAPHQHHASDLQTQKQQTKQQCMIE